MTPFLKLCDEALRLSEIKGPLYPAPKHVLTGYSGDKVLASLQRLTALCSETGTCYLEVGVFQGLSLLTVAHSCPDVRCYGIDNFAFFDPDGKNLETVRARAARLDVDNIEIINEDYELAFEDLGPRVGGRTIGVYFVDGPHDYRSQLMCLELALPYLHEDSIIVVDDSNYRHVRQANRDFLVTHPEWKLICEAYTPCHPMNIPESSRKQAFEGWWNGINVLVRDSDDQLERRLPPTGENRHIFEAEHMLFSSRVADVFPRLLKIGSALVAGHPVKLLWHMVKFRSEVRESRHDERYIFDEMNTYSGSLPEFWQASFKRDGSAGESPAKP